MDKAVEAVDKMNEGLDHPKISKGQYNALVDLYEFIKVTLNMYIGKYSGAEVFYNNLFVNADSPLSEVAAKFYLAELFRKQDFMDRALTEYKFIYENGKDTFYAKKAKEYLLEAFNGDLSKMQSQLRAN